MPIQSSLLNRLSFCLFLISIAAASIAAQVPQPSPTPTVPKAVVKGRVVYDDTNDPVRRSRINLVQLVNDRSNLTSATDRDGRFEIREVPAGVYFVLLESPGIISPISFLRGNSDNIGQPEAFDIKALREYCTEIPVDGTNTVNVTVRARRGGAISGKVTYSDGAPAVNAVISMYKRSGKERTRILNGISIAGMSALNTDDRGRYRISGLPPGDYFVAAAEKNTSPNRSRAGYDPFSDILSDSLTATYYGNGAKLSDALPIEMSLGSEINDVDIVLPDSTPHTITGTVTAKSDGRPLAGASITIKNKEQADWLSRDPQKVTSDSDGRWSFDGIPDGTYVLEADAPYETDGALVTSDDEAAEQKRLPRKPRVLPKQVDVTVGGSDVAGLSIELIDGASVSGTIEIPGGQTDRGYVVVRYAYESGSADPRNNNTPAMDGKFTIDQLKPGKIYLTADANTYGAMNEIKYYVKSITLNGNDLMQNPLTVEAGQTITNVKIVLASDRARAKIQLVDDAGKPLPAKALAVIPVDQSRRSFESQTATGVTDVDGIFPFSGAPGDYLVIAAGKDDPWPPGTEAVRAALTAANRINLKPGDNKTLTITVR